MTENTVRVEIELTSIRCCTCGVIFGMDRMHQNRLRISSEWFYCPNGHPQQYTPGKSEADKLRDELTATRARLDQWKAEVDTKDRMLEYERKQAASFKGQLTKVRNRINAGVCPCCNRHFANLHQHMTTQHADDPKAREAMVQRMKNERKEPTEKSE